MNRKPRKDIIHRWEGNPIIDIESISFTSNNMYNAGAVKRNGIYILLLTLENLEGKSSIYKATSSDGFHFAVDEKPFLEPNNHPDFEAAEALGVRDARITLIDEEYYIMYLGVGIHGAVLCLASTNDFEGINRIGVVSQPDTKAGALFPVKFNGKYSRLERPAEGGGIWISRSKDLVAWGEREIVLMPRPGFWDTDRVGCAAPPIEISMGWLLSYYSVKITSAGPITRIGAAILDRKDPTKVLQRSNIPILSPREDYERIGDIGNLVFSTGAILEDNNELKTYYGAAQNCLCAGTSQLEDIVECCLESGKDY